jgi:hypothetical protein
MVHNYSNKSKEGKALNQGINSRNLRKELQQGIAVRNPSKESYPSKEQQRLYNIKE